MGLRREGSKFPLSEVQASPFGLVRARNMLAVARTHFAGVVAPTIDDEELEFPKNFGQSWFDCPVDAPRSRVARIDEGNR